MQCGTVLREALKYEDVAIVILYSQPSEGDGKQGVEDLDLDKKQTGLGVFWQFFSWIDKGAFEVSTDAFTTFRVRHHAREKLECVLMFHRKSSSGTRSLFRIISRSISTFSSQHITAF